MGEKRQGLHAGTGLAALLSLGLALAGCSSVSLNSMTGGLLGSSSSAPSTSEPAAGVGGSQPALTDDDVPCPDVQVRTGASTLIVGRTAGQERPAPLDVRYQGSVVRMARECHVFAGAMHIKVGIEGRVITGPAGVPGTVDVPLRVAVVHNSINPVTVSTELAQIPVTINNTVDQVTFTHVYPDVTFPLPHPLGVIDSYVIYVGFDPMAVQPAKKKPRHRRRAPRPRH